MTRPKSDPGNRGAARGNANPDVDAELAALLDSEVAAIETGRAPGTAPAASGWGAAGARDDESIDVPPAGAEAQPAGGVPPQPPAAPVYERPLPVTKRFGAIIMETGGQPGQAVGLTPSGAPIGMVPYPGERALPPGPGVETEPTGPLPAPVQRTDDQKTIIIGRLNAVLNPQWEIGFHEQLNALYKEVTTEFSSPPDSAQKMLALLREARQVMIDSPADYVNAEYRLMQVRAMLDRIKESRRQSRTYGPGIFIYQTLWLLLFLAGLIFAGQIAAFIAKVGQVNGPELLNLSPVINTMLWGGIGGVVGALYALWWHISDRQDFDRHYQMWYFVQPVMGLVLGAITFLLLAGGLLILNVNIAADQASPGARLLPYLVAVLAGFKQNFVYDQLERLVSVFSPGGRKTDDTGAASGS